jgi:hypothetical protein
MLSIACGKSESAGIDLIDQVASEVKDKPHVQVSIKMRSDQPTADDEALLRSLETKIDNEQIGRLVSSGFEPGYMFLKVEVENTADAIDKLRSLLRADGLLAGASFKVLGERASRPQRSGVPPDR